MAAKSTESETAALKVVIVGDTRVGKSCLINRFVTNRFDGHSFRRKEVDDIKKNIKVDGQTYTLQICDTTGQETLEAPILWGCNIGILTYAIDDVTSCKNLTSWHTQFCKDADVKNIAFIIVGNKVDKAEEGGRVPAYNVNEICSKLGNLPLIETSAENGTNVEQAFKLAVRTWVQQEEKRDRPKGPVMFV